MIVASISCTLILYIHIQFRYVVISDTQLWIHMSLFLLLYCLIVTFLLGHFVEWKCANQFIRLLGYFFCCFNIRTITQWRNNLKSFFSIPLPFSQFSLETIMCYLVMQSTRWRRKNNNMKWTQGCCGWIFFYEF